MEKIKYFLSLLFQKTHSVNFSKTEIIILLLIGVLLILTSFVIKIWRKKTKNKINKKYLRELPRGIFWFGITDLFLVWFRVESVPFLSMRLWWLILVVTFLVWAFLKTRKLLGIKKRLKRAILR